MEAGLATKSQRGAGVGQCPNQGWRRKRPVRISSSFSAVGL
jgi:hypothetical protein